MQANPLCICAVAAARVWLSLLQQQQQQRGLTILARNSLLHSTVSSWCLRTSSMQLGAAAYGSHAQAYAVDWCSAYFQGAGLLILCTQLKAANPAARSSGLIVDCYAA
jgi:hypothetical protein